MLNSFGLVFLGLFYILFSHLPQSGNVFLMF